MYGVDVATNIMKALSDDIRWILLGGEYERHVGHRITIIEILLIGILIPSLMHSLGHIPMHKSSL